MSLGLNCGISIKCSLAKIKINMGIEKNKWRIFFVYDKF